MCGQDRTKAPGFCGMSDKIKIARAALHMWEEPPISGERGSGAVFFSGCSLRCVFCQNFEISQKFKGYFISENELADEFLRLRDIGAENINLVSPTPFLPSVMRALDKVKHRLGIPVVMNSGGYERISTIKALNGYIDVYLPDIKYYSEDLSLKYSGARDYPSTAFSAVKEMVNQVGKPMLDERGIIKKGVIVRHLILPGGRKDSEAVIMKLGKIFQRDEILLSLMRQYVPMNRAFEYKELSRKVSTFEYNFVLAAAQSIGFDGFTQEAASANSVFTPEFYDKR